MPDECPLSRDHVHIASYECEWVFGGCRRSSLEQVGSLAHVSAPQGCCVVYHPQYEGSVVWMNNGFSVSALGLLKGVLEKVNNSEPAQDSEVAQTVLKTHRRYRGETHNIL